ncbi:MAG TPA: bifunctional hydroxymethylpyrimidine kinase/phosphomethylpyrimidine kinase [Silvibacterium sp.]|nr:bifunctional hydroxymethylpyrimidine kinase/phosphomethylpyrimidine kinase [Silvibacterium sp.]
MIANSSNPGPQIALTMAGFDPSSGAGITADLKVFAAHKIYGLAAITALTVQSTQGVRRVESVSPELLRQTLDCLADDVQITGVKVGMLASEAVVGAVAAFLDQSGIPVSGIVLDPVLKSSSGHPLLTPEGLTGLKDDLLPRVGWITPNLDELAELTELPVSTREAVPEAAARLASRYPGLNIVVTGGHLASPDDFLWTADDRTDWIPGQRIRTGATHGTGCAFSSALLARLLAGDSALNAVSAAKTYVAEAMKAARPIGKGHGPLHHLYVLD